MRFKNILHENVFPIGGWYAPWIFDKNDASLDFVTDEILELVKDCGINFLAWSQCYDEGGEKLTEWLSHYGIGLFVRDSRISDMLFSAESRATRTEKMRRYISEYSGADCYLGSFFYDEPRAERFDKLKEAVEIYAEVSPQGTFPYINLLPADGEGALDENGQCSYGEYLRTFIERVKLPYISFDCYPLHTGLDQKPRLNDTYFFTLNAVATLALEHNIPFWHFVQAGGQWGAASVARENYPSEAELKWNVNTGLAFGAKGIEYFPVMQPKEFYEPGQSVYVNGLIGFNKRANKWYYYAKSINRYIQKRADFFLQATLKTVLFSGSSPIQVDKTGVVSRYNCYENITLFESNHGIVGVFLCDEKKFLMCVNNSFNEEGYIGLKFDAEYNFLIDDGREKRSPTNYELREEYALLLDGIPAGEGWIVEIAKKNT